MNARALSMSKRPERPFAVLPPPPSAPDDGPSSTDVPRLGRPPASLRPFARSGRRSWAFRPPTWLLCTLLFALATFVTLLFAR